MLRARSTKVSRCLGVLGARNRGQDTSDGFAEAIPFEMLGGKLFAPRRREPVEARAAIVGGSAPLGDHPAFLEETLERGIERTVLDFEGLAGGLLNEFGDAVAMHRSPAEGAENDEVEGALHDFEAVGCV
jgi:hypothetical protein